MSKLQEISFLDAIFKLHVQQRGNCLIALSCLISGTILGERTQQLNTIIAIILLKDNGSEMPPLPQSFVVLGVQVNNSIQVNSLNVSDSDLMASNGVIHVVKAMLYPRGKCVWLLLA